MNWPQKKNYLRPDTKLLRSALTLIQRKSFTGTGTVPAKNFKLNTGIPALYENMNKNKHLGTTVCENMNKKTSSGIPGTHDLSFKSTCKHQKSRETTVSL